MHSNYAGWNDSAELLKCHATFWHKIWCETGCPQAGIITQFKRAAKSRFKYEVHRDRDSFPTEIDHYIHMWECATLAGPAWLDDFTSKALSKPCQTTNGGEMASDIQLQNINQDSLAHVKSCSLMFGPVQSPSQA